MTDYEHNELKKMGLMERITNIQSEIKDLIKDEVNKFQNYKYFEESRILKILKPLLMRYRVSMVISDDDTQPFNHEREGNNHYLKYLKMMMITNLDNQKEGHIFKFWACGTNTDLAKAKGSAETYAMKYILSKFFLIRVLDENDPELIKPQGVNEVMASWQVKEMEQAKP